MINLRPINIISVLSKNTEKVIVNQLVNYLIENKLIPQSLQGGLKGRNSTITVINIYEKIAKVMKDKKMQL